MIRSQLRGRDQRAAISSFGGDVRRPQPSYGRGTDELSTPGVTVSMRYEIVVAGDTGPLLLAALQGFEPQPGPTGCVRFASGWFPTRRRCRGS